jgi:CubicO group peptidase (beta-lactamase class C family)
MLQALFSKKWIWLVGGVLLLAGAVVGVMAVLGVLPGQAGTLYEDPEGRFSMNVDPSWARVEADGDYVQYKMPDPPMDIYLIVLEAGTVEDAFYQAFEIVGFDTDLLAHGDTVGLEDWYLFSTEDADGVAYGLAGQTVGSNTYVFMVKPDAPGVSPENAAVFRALSSVKIAGKEEVVIGSLAELEALIRRRVDEATGSISVALVHRGEIAYTYAYGAANPAASIAADTATIYHHGSMTKIFTAVAVMQLVEQGRVDLDAWPGEYVPEFPAAWQVTVRQLLDHSACMAENDRLVTGQIALGAEPFPPLEQVFSAYVRDFADLACEPGLVSQYSNPHYLTLARIVEEVSGEPYDAYVLEHILLPLGMQSTGFQLAWADERLAKPMLPTGMADGLVTDLTEYRGPGLEAIVLDRGETYATLATYRVLPPWGGLLGTASDVTHFLQMHLAGGRYDGAQLLRPETIAAMQEMQTAKDGDDLGVGLGWWPGEDAAGAYRYHSGSTQGMQSTMRIYPELDLGVVVMGNMEGYQPEAIATGLVSAWVSESK